MSSQLKILAVETLLVDVPTIRPHRLSVATMNHQTLVLVRVETSDGVVGWGEGTTIGGLAYGEESPESIKVNIDTYIAPMLVGTDKTPSTPMVSDPSTLTLQHVLTAEEFLMLRYTRTAAGTGDAEPSADDVPTGSGPDQGADS